LQILSLLSKNSSVFSLMSILSSGPEILASICSSLLEWLSTLFLIWFKGIFICRISVWLVFFFWDFLYLWLTSPSYHVLSSLFHLSLFYNLLSFISEFVEILLEFI
jgi:hypothetical protein